MQMSYLKYFCVTVFLCICFFNANSQENTETGLDTIIDFDAEDTLTLEETLFKLKKDANVCIHYSSVILNRERFLDKSIHVKSKTVRSILNDYLLPDSVFISGSTVKNIFLTKKKKSFVVLPIKRVTFYAEIISDRDDKVVDGLLKDAGIQPKTITTQNTLSFTVKQTEVAKVIDVLSGGWYVTDSTESKICLEKKVTTIFVEIISPEDATNKLIKLININVPPIKSNRDTLLTFVFLPEDVAKAINAILDSSLFIKDSSASEIYIARKIMTFYVETISPEDITIIQDNLKKAGVHYGNFNEQDTIISFEVIKDLTQKTLDALIDDSNYISDSTTKQIHINNNGQYVRFYIEIKKEDVFITIHKLIKDSIPHYKTLFRDTLISFNVIDLFVPEVLNTLLKDSTCYVSDSISKPNQIHVNIKMRFHVEFTSKRDISKKIEQLNNARIKYANMDTLDTTISFYVVDELTNKVISIFKPMVVEVPSDYDIYINRVEKPFPDILIGASLARNYLFFEPKEQIIDGKVISFSPDDFFSFTFETGVEFDEIRLTTGFSFFYTNNGISCIEEIPQNLITFIDGKVTESIPSNTSPFSITIPNGQVEIDERDTSSIESYYMAIPLGSEFNFFTKKSLLFYFGSSLMTNVLIKSNNTDKKETIVPETFFSMKMNFCVDYSLQRFNLYLKPAISFNLSSPLKNSGYENQKLISIAGGIRFNLKKI